LAQAAQVGLVLRRGLESFCLTPADTMTDGADEPEAWIPNGIIAMNAPKPKPVVDHRWRAPRKDAELPKDPRERTWRAVSEQCLNARMPGYTGFIPSKKAEDIYGYGGASMGRNAVAEQSHRARQRQEASQLLASMPAQDNATLRFEGEPPAEMPAEHPLGKSRAEMGGGHWVPTIPGYGGYIPGKHAENIVGGGVIDTCKMAGNTIAKRSMPAQPRPAATMENSQVRQYYHARNVGDGLNMEVSPSQAQLAADLREHCSKQIPGYAGFVPRIHGESIYGATTRNANLIAADLCEDKIINPEAHQRSCCAPVAPELRKLRF